MSPAEEMREAAAMLAESLWAKGGNQAQAIAGAIRSLPAPAPASPPGVLGEEEIAAIARREAGATDGPWEAKPFDMDREHVVVFHGHGGGDSQWLHAGNATFIAAARSDIPALLRSHAALSQRVADLEKPRRCDDAAQAWLEVKEGLAREDVLRAKLQVAWSGVDDVWRWIGDGLDHPESLSCPVVMSAERLREFVAARAQVATLRDSLNAAISDVLKVGAERDGLRADLAAVTREADRLRHGQGVEGDHVCPADLRADRAEKEVERLREQAAEAWAALTSTPIATLDIGRDSTPDERIAAALAALTREPAAESPEPTPEEDDAPSSQDMARDLYPSEGADPHRVRYCAALAGIRAERARRT